ncbi:Flp pilus assembly complex ATPase component TadA [Patescibacteria group bacterium AH-259-L05]|nr:Flp pilus assembly complex ATPase component TadA [Patescibacteria group bacterium AH-259-L05]
MSTQTNILLNKICSEAASMRASEIYLLPAQVPFIRIYGKVRPLEKESIIAGSFISDAAGILLDSPQQEMLKKEKQIVAVKELSRIGFSQINFYYQRGSLALRIKLLSSEIVDISKLEVGQMVVNFSSLKSGIVFICGPRDSGRSTLAFSLLNEINKNERQFIATVEKPIENVMRGIKSVVEQREVGTDIGSFIEGLRYIRTRNADVVMISEVKSGEVIDELFAISEAGSLVFAILDTGSALKTVKRILHFFPMGEKENIQYFLSENLGGIVCSRLVPKIGGGRILALEILPGTPAVKSLIAADKLHQLAGALQATEDQTSISLDQYLADLVKAGKVTSDDALQHSVDEEVLKTLLRR